ncbi:MAG: hypothetical protein PHZ02_07320 [Desulfocapsaceae bacterium]|nr:hypothetical protein [Desulfocapsaceae bacterium]
MIINLSPQRSDKVLAVSKQGDVLTINGDIFDFSVIPDDAILPATAITCDWISGDVARIGGEIILTLIMPHGAGPSSTVAFPSPLNNPPDGQVELPQ